MRGRVRLWALLALLLLILLSACAGQEAQRQQGPWLWFVEDSGIWTADTTALRAVPYTGAETAEAYLTALLAGPEAGSGLASPIPSGTRLLGCVQDGRRTLRVDLSEGYGALAGIDLTLSDYCITLTLTQLDGVERVIITAGGQPLTHRYWQHHSADQVIFSGAEEEPVEYTAPLCFPRSDGRGLGLEVRALRLTEDDVLADRVLQALLNGPEDQSYVGLIPPETEVLELRIDGGVCYVDLSVAFVEGCPADGGQQELILYSLVNTLGNLETVSSVQLLVEGERLTRYGQTVLPALLEPDFGLVIG